MTTGPNFTFSGSLPEAEAIAQRFAAELVVQVSAETRAAIRQVIVDAIAQGIPPYEAAKLIVGTLQGTGQQGVAGLTVRQAKAVANFRRQLINVGVPVVKVDGKVSRYAKKLLRMRARNIARTESMSAINRGVKEAWRQNKKALGYRGLVEEWIVTPDDRLCPVCLPLDGVQANDEGNFADYSNPPAHPQCRCTMGLVVGTGAVR